MTLAPYRLAQHTRLAPFALISASPKPGAHSERLTFTSGRCRGCGSGEAGELRRRVVPFEGEVCLVTAMYVCMDGPVFTLKQIGHSAEDF